MRIHDWSGSLMVASNRVSPPRAAKQGVIVLDQLLWSLLSGDLELLNP